jgi:ABC-type glycerol-3-phosphate transport system permease component
MAGNILAGLPLVVVFLFAVRYFIHGLTASALKM